MNRRTWMSSVGASLFVTRLRSHSQPAVSAASIAVAFQWQSEIVPNALATATRHHVLANDAVSAFTVTGTAAGRTFVLRHMATPDNRLYDPARHLYTTTPAGGFELERLLDPRARATFSVDLSFTLSTFFDVLLAQMTRSDEDLYNLARPTDSEAILSTFERTERDGKVSIDYRSETHSVAGVPCRLVDVDVTPPAVKLVFEIDFHTGIDALRRTAMRKLIAMDWSRLAGFAKSDAPLPPHVELWKNNLLVFLANQTDMRRAERFRTSIASRHATKEPRQLVNDVRKDIDAHIVTANHWGETREDLRTERHQAILSDLLGSLHKSASPASPTHLSRDLARIHGLNLDQQAAMTLQYGTGYCGEHSRTSFSILRTIMSIPGNKLDNIVLCGNANIDHGFVLCNLEVTHVIFTIATSPSNTRVSVGEGIRVFNLRDALARSPGREVFVLDPYLDPSMISRTAERLLRSLNSMKKRRRGKDTDFLMFQLQFPVPAEVTMEDIRHRSIAERMTLVRNV